MKKTVILLGLLMSLLNSAFAEESIISQSKMINKESQNGFVQIKVVHLMLMAKDGKTPTKIRVEYREPVMTLPEEGGPSWHNAVKDLDLVQVHQDKETGTTHYFAGLPAGISSITQERFNVHLIDYSTSFSIEGRVYEWEAHLRQGYGLIDTNDSTMTALGFSKQTLRAVTQ